MVNLKDSTVFDYIRYVGSFALLMFSTVVTFYAILEQKTSFWKAVPGWAALIIFLLVLFLLGVMEGIQIALVELKRQDPETYKESHPQAYRLGQIAAKGDNIERFLMGRQVFVVCLVFFAAKLTTIHGRNPDGFLFPVPEIVQVGSPKMPVPPSDLALGDRAVGLRHRRHCGPAHPPNHCQHLPGGVHADNSGTARLLRLRRP